MPFLVPPKWLKRGVLTILGVPKIALWMPESKFIVSTQCLLWSGWGKYSRINVWENILEPLKISKDLLESLCDFKKGGEEENVEEGNRSEVVHGEAADSLLLSGKRFTSFLAPAPIPRSSSWRGGYICFVNNAMKRSPKKIFPTRYFPERWYNIRGGVKKTVFFNF